ncbi:EamA family transporter RarD [Salinicola acroporae]|uniref:EamA family transporter RarD n=1 Tax=Salinicola acroporae TaxID=1541440 RepID=A0ABT6I628_9GAMM|nr:EamA family transporter RarD [Salinicola acroporae]MDH4573116.1 EamA family transporter RarD [Salinicola acroporae]
MSASPSDETPPGNVKPVTDAPRHEARRGVGYGVTAYALWGCFPLFFSLFDGVPAFEVLIQRILWSCIFLIVVVTLMGRWPAIRSGFPGQRETIRGLGWILGCALLIALNWGLYIYAVETHRVLQASLGYFMTPLVNVALGMLVLRERLGRWQKMAIGLALAAVILQLVLLGTLPWISLVLAMTFGSYGLLRKRVPLDALSGLLVETSLLLPLSLATLAWLAWHGQSHFGASLDVTALMIVSGVVTTLPLLAFAGATKRLTLSTIGFLMYLNPTLQFLLALWIFGEPLVWPQLLTFALIWISLGLYSVGAWQSHRKALAHGPDRVAG